MGSYIKYKLISFMFRKTLVLGLLVAYAFAQGGLDDAFDEAEDAAAEAADDFGEDGEDLADDLEGAARDAAEGEAADVVAAYEAEAEVAKVP